MPGPMSWPEPHEAEKLAEQQERLAAKREPGAYLAERNPPKLWEVVESVGNVSVLVRDATGGFQGGLVTMFAKDLERLELVPREPLDADWQCPDTPEPFTANATAQRG